MRTKTPFEVLYVRVDPRVAQRIAAMAKHIGVPKGEVIERLVGVFDDCELVTIRGVQS